jgi:hypothetical protein
MTHCPHIETTEWVLIGMGLSSLHEHVTGWIRRKVDDDEEKSNDETE